MYKKNPRDPNFEIVTSKPDYVIIRDLGPWDVHRSITNGAEEAVAEMFHLHKLGSRRLGYYDSEGELGELVHDGAGKFIEFGPVFKLERCPTCAEPVTTMFDHIAEDCEHS